MKIRTMKLRQAHNNNNNNNNGSSSSSVCSILWSSNSQHIVTASSSDNSIAIHDAVVSSSSPPTKFLRNHHEGVTALALTPNSTCLASASLDHSVKLYKFPGGDFDTNITRFTLPIRSIAFNKSGTILAAAGDDEGIKLVNTIDGTIARVLKGHKASLTSLAFDPKGEYLASLDSTGTLIYWELHSGNTLFVLKSIAPNNGSSVHDDSLMNILAWSPDGDMLAVPGLRNDVVLYDRDTSEKLFSLRGDHSRPVCFLSWSPNGKYMATSALDNQILIWDVVKKQDIDRQKFNDRVSGMAWKPQGNALAVIDVTGKYGVWESVVPSPMKSPTEDIPDLSLRNTSSGFHLFDEEEEPVASASMSSDHSYGESEPPSRKRLRPQSKYYEHDWDIDNNNDETESIPKVESRKKPFHGQKGNLKDKMGSRTMTATSGPKMQEAFQPGTTPAQPGKRHFLCYNMLGSITTMEHDGYSHIEIDFHDTSSGPRVPAMTDHFGFTMASLNEDGSIFANPCKGEKNMSTLMYRPFSSWANNSEWSMRFEGEEVKAIALGSTWVAAVTSLNFLRIFTKGGLQRDVFSLDGPVVTAAGHKDELAIITHISPSLPSEEQMLEFRVLNIPLGTQSLRGRLPLTPGSSLTWLGFSEEGQLSSFDSKGVLRVYFTHQYGGSWLPLFSTSKLKKSEENHWVVGLNANKLFCVVCNSPEYYPQVTPKPVLTLLDLSFPLASSDLGADSLENEFMMNNMHLSRIQKNLEESAAAGHDCTSLDDEAFNLEISLDRCILRLIASCCNGDKLVRATELVKLLSLEKSIRGAIKLVTALKLPNLAERFNSILEEKLVSEKVGNSAVVLPLNNSDSGGPPPPPPPVHSLLLNLNAEKDGNAKSKENNNNVATTTSVEVKENTGKLKEVKSVGESIKGKTRQVLDQPLISIRPSNPFAKSSTKQETPSSLLESVKKMKGIIRDS